MSTDSKYQQLARELEAAIRGGQLAVGSRLPSVRQVMEQRRLSLATVVSAYRALEERGLITAQPKRGYFVAPPPGDAPQRPAAARPAAPVNPACPAADLLPRQRLQRLTAAVVRRHQYLSTTYAEGPGNARLCAEIARRSAEAGSFVRADEVIITNGATEALLLALRATTRPGDAVAVESPANPLFLSLLAEMGLEAVEIPVADGGVDAAALERLIAARPRLRALLLVPNFHHPTGTLMPVPAKRALVELAQRSGLILIEDDVYGDLQHEGPRPPPLKAFDSGGDVIYLNSFSKTTAPGLRVGWLASGRHHASIEAARRRAGFSAAELPQLVIYEFLNRGSHLPHLRRLRGRLRDQTLRLHEALQREVGDVCRWRLPLGGYFLWLELPAPLNASALLAETPHPGLLAGECCSLTDSAARGLRINTTLFDPDALPAFAATLRHALDRSG